MKLSLIFLGALVSVGLASPTLHRRKECETLEDCEPEEFCASNDEGSSSESAQWKGVTSIQC